MSRGTLIGAVIVCLGLGGGLWAFTADDEPATQTDKEDTDARGSKRKRGKRGKRGPQRDGDLETRVAALEDEVEALRLELKKSRMVRPPRALGGSPRAARLDDSEAGEAPQFEGAVRDIIEADRAEAIEKRTDFMRERFAERRAETLKELVAVAGITKAHQESIGELWEAESDQIVPLFVAAREGDRPFEEVREEATKLREETDQAVEEMLSPEQFEKYQEMRPGPGGRGDRRGERRGPPPG